MLQYFRNSWSVTRSHLRSTLDGYTSLLNGLLRASTIASRFLLLLILLKTATPEVMGTYGMVSATIAYISLLIGADFYQYAQREIISHPLPRRSFVIQHQGVVTLMSYTVLLPTTLLLFSFDLLPKALLGIFYALTISEHLGQEVGRTLTAISRTVIAGVVLFLRSASWIWILAASSLLGNTTTLDSLLELWLLGSIAGLALGLAILHREIQPWRKWPLDLPWIWRGVRKSFLFFSATIALKGMTTLDRYMMQLTSESDIVGAYVAYVGIAMTLINLLDAVVFAPLFPTLVKYRAENDHAAYAKQYRKIHHQTWIFATISSIILMLLGPYVFQSVGKSIYLNHLAIYYLLLAAIFMYAVSMVPHYALYAKGQDIAIVSTQIIALVPFIVTFAIVYHTISIYGPALSLLTAFLFIFIAKTLLNKRYT